MEKNSRIEFPKIDEETQNKFYKIIQKYNTKIPKGIEFYMDEILNGENLELYAKQFDVTKDEIIKYAEVYKIVCLYKQIKNSIEFFKNEIQDFELIEYEEIIEESVIDANYLKDWIENFENNSIDSIDHNQDLNLVIFPKFVEEYLTKTLQAKSGREIISLKAILSIISQMKQAEYLKLRTNANIHQMQNQTTKKPAYIADCAYERMGRGTTKVTYIRVPISEKNKSIMKKYYDINLEMLYLVLSYGDFKNESVDEIWFYREHYFNTKRNEEEISHIVDIFKNDFTDETFKEAQEIIKISLLLNEQMEKTANSENLNKGSK